MRADEPKRPRKRGGVRLLGFGLDSDGHVRQTRGDHLLLHGGSKETHARMMRRAEAILQELDRRGYRLDNIDREDCPELAKMIGEINAHLAANG